MWHASVEDSRLSKICGRPKLKFSAASIGVDDLRREKLDKEDPKDYWEKPHHQALRKYLRRINFSTYDWDVATDFSDERNRQFHGGNVKTETGMSSDRAKLQTLASAGAMTSERVRVMGEVFRKYSELKLWRTVCVTRALPPAKTESGSGRSDGWNVEAKREVGRQLREGGRKKYKRGAQ